MLDKTLLALEEVMKNEYRMAAVRHGGTFASTHEGYAVILEEVEEAKADLNALELYVDALWRCVKADKYTNDEQLKVLQRRAIHAAGELIQVAAMVYKFKHSQDVQIEIEKEEARGC